MRPLKRKMIPSLTSQNLRRAEGKSTFNSKINSIATDEEIIKYAQVKPQNASATYNSNLIDFIEKIETNDSEMQKFFPNLKKNSSEIQNKTVYPTPYTKLYFKHYAEDLNTIKRYSLSL